MGGRDVSRVPVKEKGHDKKDKGDDDRGPDQAAGSRIRKLVVLQTRQRLRFADEHGFQVLYLQTLSYSSNVAAEL
jgi:hypothetical protein